MNAEHPFSEIAIVLKSPNCIVLSGKSVVRIVKRNEHLKTKNVAEHSEYAAITTENRPLRRRLGCVEYTQQTLTLRDYVCLLSNITTT